MSFHERFKGRTSLIDKEGITGVVKSQAKPILKPEDSPIEYKKNTSSLEIIPEKNFSKNQTQTRNVQKKMFKFQDGIIEKGRNNDMPGFNLKVDPERTIKNYSYDSPLLERMKEEEDIKAINSYKTNLSYSLNHINMKTELSSPLKKDYYGQDLYSSNILINNSNNSLLYQKNPLNSHTTSGFNGYTKQNFTNRTRDPPLMQYSPTNSFSNPELNQQFMSPIFRDSENKQIGLLKSNHKNNNYLKNESIFDKLEHNLVLPILNQKTQLSNSGRNIVLSNSNLIENNEDKRNNVIEYYNNLNDKANSHEKEKLDYELSKLENQYKDILAKFSFLSKKRELLN